ncbi:maleylpyruvate isomerase family mycothiol-dependent enzyme [Crossiella sp. CA198]|uniref:maleylpyruvate isomerase family mycothiol-dependent enzyme n=1 Tax=Crossiella sp. CA198 TaxID=3455607 RepID=UPI003F8D32C1
MDFHRHAAEIRVQTALFGDLAGADLRAPVPSCPGWSLGNLVRHVGYGHRWAAEIIRTRATGFLPDDKMRKLDGDDSRPLPVDWLVEGATELSEALRAAGPGTTVWTPLTSGGGTDFWARRFAHETVMHRADATLAAGIPFTVATEVALDTVDEWMWLDSLAQHFDYNPGKRALLAPGRTLAFEATDADAAWFVDLTGEVIVSGRGRGAAAVTVRAPLTDLLLALYRRKPFSGNGITVSGDTALLEFWLTHIGFG